MAGAPKKNKNAKGNKGGGRKPKYLPIFATVAKNLCQHGATNADLALAFDVAGSTIWHWQAKYVEFFESCKIGKSHFDESIKQAFYQRARGYDYVTEKVFQNNGRIVRAKTIEHVPADVNAARFWLINRCRAEFRDEKDMMHDITPRLASLMAHISGNRFMPKMPQPAAVASRYTSSAPVIEGKLVTPEDDQ